MRIEVFNTMEQVDRDQWNALVQSSTRATIYQTYEFNHAASQIYGQEAQAFIICVKDEDKLLAILPLMFSTFKNKRLLRFIAAARSDYNEMICPANQEEIFPLVWAYILSKRDSWDLIQLENVPFDAYWAKYRKEDKDLKYLSHASSREEAVSLRFDDKVHAQKVLHKKKIIKYREYLQKNGDYKVEHLTRPADIELALEDFWAQHTKRWQNTAFPSLFNEHKNREFYRLITKTLPEGWITLSALKWNNEVVAYHFGFSYGCTFIWYKPSFNMDFAKFSVGQVLLQEVMEYALNRDFKEFDFGVGAEGYKYRFGNVIKYNNSFKIYASTFAYFCNYLPQAIQWRLKKAGSEIFQISKIRSSDTF